MSAPLPEYINVIGIRPVGQKIQEHILIQTISLREMTTNDFVIDIPDNITKLVFVSTKEKPNEDSILDNSYKFMLGS